MSDQEQTIVESLAHIGISITPHAQAGRGWGWSIQSDKIIRDWDGPYDTPTATIGAALSWLLEHARKGLLCHHVHTTVVDDDPLAPWLRAFPSGISLVE